VTGTGAEDCCRKTEVDPINQATTPTFARITAAAIHGQTRRAEDAAGRRAVRAAGTLISSRSRSAFFSASRI
jgi:hypothetical protein